MAGRATATVALVTLFLVGCGSFGTLSRSLEEIGHAGTARITIDNTTGRPSSHLVMLFEVETLQLAQLELARSGEPVVMRCWPGRYLVAAFEDRDADLQHDDDEPAIILGVPHGFALGGEASGVDLVARLDPSAPQPGEQYPELAQRMERANAGLVFNNVGTVASLAEDRFEAANGKLGMWEPTRFGRRKLHGLYMLEEYDPSRSVVVFVHGIGSTPRDLAPLIDALDSSRFQAWVFFYPSAMGLADLGAYLAKSLRLMDARYRPQFLGIVAHSMGGLVAREALDQLQGSVVLEKVPWFVSVASPFGGVASASWGVDFAPAVMPCWVDLVPGSEFLEALFRERLDGVPHHLVFAFQRSGLVGPSGDGTVPLRSQLVPRAQAAAATLLGVDAGHEAVLSHPVLHDWFAKLLESTE